MKLIRNLILAAISLASLVAPQTVLAQTTAGQTNPSAPVAIVPQTGQNLNGAPPQIQSLIISFNATREKYLAAQNLLLIKLKNATTAEERQKIRELLQDNRLAFMTALSDFRAQLQDELTALKGKISHQEFLQIIDAAHDAATEGGIHHHRGQ
jgi:dihydroxyacetone kinase-like predicted kinase